MAVKVAINGFGRIGMMAARVLSGRSDMELVAINAVMKPEMAEYLLKFDTIHGRFDAKLIDDKTLMIGHHEIALMHDRNPEHLNFGEYGAEVVLECTGAILSSERARAHLREGVRKVIFSAPAKDDTPMFVYGVNNDKYAGEEIISNASCTTNCLAPVVKILHEAFGIEKGLMTTVHSYTNDQSMLDVKHEKDVRRARAAALNMIPTTTGAAKAIGLVIPELQGKLNGFSVRVPTADVSMIDLTAHLKKGVTKDELNTLFKEAALGAYKGLVDYDESKRVSSDFIGDAHSAIFVPDCTQIVEKDLVKVIAWYDNEWGYSNRLVDMAKYVGEH